MWPCIKCGKPTDNRRPVGAGVTVPACEGTCERLAAPLPLSKKEIIWQRKMQAKEQRRIEQNEAILRRRERATPNHFPQYEPQVMGENAVGLPVLACSICGKRPRDHRPNPKSVTEAR